MSDKYPEEVQLEIDRVYEALGDRVTDLDKDNIICYAMMVVIEHNLYEELQNFWVTNENRYMTIASNGQKQTDPTLGAFRQIAKERRDIGDKLGLSPKSRGENLRESKHVEEDVLEALVAKGREH